MARYSHRRGRKRAISRNRADGDWFGYGPEVDDAISGWSFPRQWMVKQCGGLVSKFLGDGSLDLKDGRLDEACPIGRTARPVLSIVATDDTAVEGESTGTFTISRTGSTAEALTVYLVIKGTAINGTDYTLVPSTVTLPAGASSVEITITPTDDGSTEGDETVIIALDPPVSHSNYYIDPAASEDTVTISEPGQEGCFPTSNLIVWHSADALTGTYNDDDEMTAGWLDNSSNGHTAEAPSFDPAPVFKTNVQNSLPAVRVTSGDYLRYLGTEIEVVNTSLTLYTVLNYTTGTPVGEGIFIEFFQNISTNGGYIFVDGGVANPGDVGFYTEADGQENLALAASGWQVLTWVLDKDTQTSTLYRDGVFVASGAFPAAGIDFGPDQINYFSFQGGGNWFVGDVGEIAIYSAAHNQATVEAACTCLMTKWGIDIEEQ